MSGIMNMFVATKTTIATAVDAFFNSVSLLLNTSSTNGAQNNTFLDSSTNNFTITRNGNTTQGTFTPFSQTGWGNYFNGSSQLSTVANPNLAFGTGAITFECWINTLSTNNMGMWGTTNEAAWTANSYAFNYYNGDIILWNNSTLWSIAVGTLHDGNWHHIAIVRSGTTWQVFADGVSKGTTTTEGSRDLGNNAWRVAIGQIEPSGGDTKFFIGYLSNMRVSNTAIYTSNFTPSTTPLTTTSQGVSSTNVKFLSIQSNRFVDNSTNATTFTVIGTPSVQAFSPFLPTAAYDTAVVGGSGYFDGSSDWLSVVDGTWITLSNNDFTAECWVYNTVSTGGTQTIFGQGNSAGSSTSVSFELYINSGRTISGGIYIGSQKYATSTGTLSLNAWNHVALVRDGGNVRIYINGVQDGVNTTAGTSSVTDQTSQFALGRPGEYNGQYFNGYISNFRFVNGTCLYPNGTTFTVPTAPLTAVTNTQLLLNYTNAGIIDSASKNVLETVGNAQVSTTQAKFGTTSMYFNGTTDGMKLPDSPNLEFGSGNLTIEMWINTTSSTQYATLFSRSPATFASGMWNLMINQSSSTAGDVSFYAADYSINTPLLLTTGVSVRDGSWHYIAIVRNGSAWTLYVDGTSRATGTWSGTIADLTTGPVIGYDQFYSRLYAGYIDELRVTKGYARTISASPTAAFPTQ